jgi:hypothetical protein
MVKEIGLEKLIHLVTVAVIQALRENGYKISTHSTSNGSGPKQFNEIENATANKKVVVDMSKYRTPVLTENQVQRLHELTGSALVPEGTIITPKAKEILKQRNIQIIYE